MRNFQRCLRPRLYRRGGILHFPGGRFLAGRSRFFKSDCLAGFFGLQRFEVFRNVNFTGFFKKRSPMACGHRAFD